MRLGAVLDDRDAALPRQLHDRIHVARPARQMHGDDGAGARREHGPDRVRRQVLAVRIDIGHHRYGATGHRATRRGDEGARRHDHLIASPDFECVEGQLQRQCAVGQGNGVAHAAEGGKLLLEGLAFASGPVIHLARSKDA
jgi:hypothetical protein